MKQPKFAPLIIHEPWGMWFHDDTPKSGYSSRASYAMGLDKPNYPMPAIIYSIDYDCARVFIVNETDGGRDVWWSKPHPQLYSSLEEKFTAMEQAYDTYY
jgi:hypothetical protein